MLWISGILKGHLSHCMWWILQDLFLFESDPLPFLPKTHSLLFVLVGHRASNIASKLVRHSHLRALSSSISINNQFAILTSLTLTLTKPPSAIGSSLMPLLLPLLEDSNELPLWKTSSSLNSPPLLKPGQPFYFHIFFNPLICYWGKKRGKWKKLQLEILN